MAFEHKRSSEMEFRDAPNVVLFQIPRLQSLVRFVIITTKGKCTHASEGTSRLEPALVALLGQISCHYVSTKGEAKSQERCIGV